MVFDISQLKKIRKHLDLTQSQFAKEIGISQSMIAKIESNKLDPTYSYVKKIEQAINSLTKNEEKEAKDIMNKKIISVKKETIIKEIIKLLTKHNISQVPVIEKNHVIGLITESNILENKADTQATEIMTESPPIIDKNAKISIIVQLLKFYPIIIVKEKEKLIGVITKADIIKAM